MLYSRLRNLSGGGGTGTEHQQIWRLLSSKLAKLLATAIVAFLVALLWIRGFRPSNLYGGIADLAPNTFEQSDLLTQDYAFDGDDYHPGVKGKGRLHLLIPATSTNDELCKLLLSAQVLGYPTPVLINYGDHEAKDGYVQHLAKVEGILRYLEKLERSDEYMEDLVLIIDGYDIWFQLRPDVLIKRFYAINAAANSRTIERYGEKLFAEREMYQSVVFGPDKLCWPVDFSRPACWAVPDSTMSDYAFGPLFEHEDRDKNPAKWLNSGTVMGTTRDLKDIFNATLEAINFNHVTDSDQYYFANLWGDQEFERLTNRPDLLEKAKSKLYYDEEDPNNNTLVRTEPITFGKRTEYHIGIDYDSSMFQTLAFWKGQLAWTREIDSWSPPADTHFMPENPWEINLSEDILASRPPFESIDYGFNHTNSTPPGWESVELAYNVLTHQHPVLMHVTGNPFEKNFRKYWWSRMWFQKKAEKLRLATHREDEKLISQEPIGNLLWYAAEPTEDAEEIVDGGKGGAWTDRRGWVSWRRLCRESEGELYMQGDDEYYHPSPSPNTTTSSATVEPTGDNVILPDSQPQDEYLREGQIPPAQAPEEALPGTDQQPQAAAPPGTPADVPAAVEMPAVIPVEQVAEQPAIAEQEPPAPQAARAAEESAPEEAPEEPAQFAARQ
ncbi:hypothetical protein Slin15195_G120970 [Septoria linicola]|uniref:Uncharacterized protein n=1 Tax=Septoria linicola TaxID=215465 RepID=A0A9Q9B4H3_9PEZI|nr:hypothetical protein Slin15195_G120970 [Septoria linicola]